MEMQLAGQLIDSLTSHQPRPVVDILQALQRSIAESKAKVRPALHAKTRKRTAA